MKNLTERAIRLALLLEPEQHQKLETIKKENGQTITWQIRKAIDDYLKNYKS